MKLPLTGHYTTISWSGKLCCSVLETWAHFRKHYKKPKHYNLNFYGVVSYIESRSCPYKYVETFRPTFSSGTLLNFSFGVPSPVRHMILTGIMTLIFNLSKWMWIPDVGVPVTRQVIKVLLMEGKKRWDTLNNKLGQNKESYQELNSSRIFNVGLTYIFQKGRAICLLFHLTYVENRDTIQEESEHFSSQNTRSAVSWKSLGTITL